LKGNFHDQFLEGWVGAIPPGYSADGETRMVRAMKVRAVPTPLSPLLANIALNGIEEIHQSIRYADDMVFILKPQDNAEAILEKICQFLAHRGMKISEKKTQLTRTTDGFDFLGWHSKVQANEKFRSTPSKDIIGFKYG
jgi:hypothetical protein